MRTHWKKTRGRARVKHGRRHDARESLRHCLPAQRLNIKVVRRCRHDQKGNDGRLALGLDQQAVQPCQRLEEEVRTLVAVLVAAREEEEQRLVKVKVKMAVEVAPHKRADFFLRLHRRSVADVSTEDLVMNIE